MAKETVILEKNDKIPVKLTKRKCGKKASASKIYISTDKEEAAKMVGRIKEEAEYHHGCVKELKRKLEKLADAAFEELVKVKELHGLILNMENHREKAESDAPVGGMPPTPFIPDKKPPEEQEGKNLDKEMEKLLIIKRLITGSPTPSFPKETPQSENKTETNGQKKILVVDDDPTTVKIIHHFLSMGKYTVSSSLSGVEGLKRAFTEKPDLILLDIMMPDLDGFQFLSILRKDGEFAEIPVVILSSLSEEADVLKGLGTGAVDYITKPFSPQILLAKIKKNLNLEK